MLNKTRVLVLTRYGALGASSRLRFFQYFPDLNAAGIQFECQHLFCDSALLARYKNEKYDVSTVLSAFYKRIKILFSRRDFDVIWIEKEALPWFPLWFESTLLSDLPYVLDFDDAIFHNYDLHRFGLVRSLYGKRLNGLMAKSALVVCGNSYLASVARASGALWVEQLPTVIDLDRYHLQKKSQILIEQTGYVPRIVWIGSPSTVKYLSILRQALQELAQRMPFILRIIGANFVLPGVQVECISWSEATEVDDIGVCDVGVMPLEDSAWERGKCGYKLIQYMACGLSVVASDVGVNNEIVKAGVTGYLASTKDDWLDALETLLNDTEKRNEFGQAGRTLVEEVYCSQKTGPVLINFLEKVAKRI